MPPHISLPIESAMVQVFIPKEVGERERRVAATAETVSKLSGDHCAVIVEAGAGDAAGILDEDYAAAGAEVVSSDAAPWSTADVIAKVGPLSQAEAEQIKEGAVVACLCKPHRNLDVVQTLRDRKVSTLSLELIPRTTRAQSMDVLSSQANIAGYKAALLGAARAPRYFPMFMTAAGTVKPSRVVVIGAGVAGLQAIATCRRLGAIVEVSDIREAAKEEAESLGARFIEVPKDEEGGEGQGGYAKEMKEDFLRRQREILAQRIAASNVVITTALIPGRPAPRLVSKDMVEGMKPGGVVIDLAGEEGGNCELSEADAEVVHGGVTILAPTDLASQLSVDASMLIARNIKNLLDLVIGEAGITLDVEDEIIDGALLTHGGEVRHAPTREKLEGGA